MTIEEFKESLKIDKLIEELEDKVKDLQDKFEKVQNGELEITESDVSKEAEFGEKISEKLKWLKALKELNNWN
jgi:hypothetical protein